MFAFAVDHKQLDRAAEKMAATDKQIEAARTSALRKFGKRFETRVNQAAARQLRIPQKALGGRFFSSSVSPGDDELRIWIGTWSVSPFSIGAPSQNKFGVRVGRRSYRGAFLGQVYTGQNKVWIRLHSRHFDPELYPTRKRSGDRGLSDLRGRFPVVRAAVPIDGVISSILALQGKELAAEFATIYEQELNYQVFVKGGSA